MPSPYFICSSIPASSFCHHLSNNHLLVNLSSNLFCTPQISLFIKRLSSFYVFTLENGFLQLELHTRQVEFMHISPTCHESNQYVFVV
jgi:hypothetical protein